MALVGPSGAGKSTLFDLLLRFYDPDTGQILIDGVDSRMLALTDLRQCFALVPQNPALFHGTIADNIRYARPEASDTAMVEAARIAHADEFIRKLPKGYETPLGDTGLGLSGGRSSGWRLPAHCLRMRLYCYWMRRPAHWMQKANT